MRQSLSPSVVVALLAAVVLAIALGGYLYWNQSSGPPDSVTKMTDQDMVRQRRSGPPPGPPLPTANGRPPL